MIDSQPYERIKQDYDETLQWLQSLGVTLGSGRSVTYHKAFDKVVLGYQSNESVDVSYPEFMNAAFEIMQLIAIKDAFSLVELSSIGFLKDRLQKAMSGPLYRVDEKQNTTAPRNFLFELTTIARMYSPESGLKCIINARNDVGIKYGKHCLRAECKRITKLGQLSKRVAEASKQLKSELTKMLGSGNVGLVVIDISKLIEDGGQIYAADTDDVLELETQKVLDHFIFEHSDVLQATLSSAHPKVLGVVVRCAFMGVSKERNLPVYISQWGIVPRDGIANGHQTLLKNLAND